MIQEAPPLWQPSNVRIATQADEEGLFFLLVNDLQADNDMHYPVSMKRTYEHVRACCRGERGIAGVIDGPDGIVASVGIGASQLWYSDKWLLAEIWAFVHPDFRKGTGYGDDLFRFAQWHREDMSRRVGYEIDLERGVRSYKRLKAKMRFWGRYGTQIGGIFLTGGTR